MEEERLIHLLRGLPREAAPGGFTAEVLQRLDRPQRAPRLARPGAAPPQRRLHPQRWHRLMVATATVGALGVSVGVSVGLLQRERSPLPLAGNLAPLAQMSQISQMSQMTRTAGTRMTRTMAASAGAAGFAASQLDRTFRHEGAAGELPVLGGAAAASGRARGLLDRVQAHQMLRELQLESARLERELHSLRLPGRGSPPTVLYLGGDDNVDLVLNTARLRAQAPPAGERDDGENQNFL